MSDRNYERTEMFMQSRPELQGMDNTVGQLDNVSREMDSRSFVKMFSKLPLVEFKTLNEEGFRDSRLLDLKSDLIDRIEVPRENVISISESNKTDVQSTPISWTVDHYPGEIYSIVLRVAIDQLTRRIMLITFWKLVAQYVFSATGEPNLYSFSGETCHILMVMAMSSPLGEIMARKTMFTGLTSAYQLLYTNYDVSKDEQYNMNWMMRGPTQADLDLPTPFFGSDLYGIMTRGHMVNMPEETSPERVAMSGKLTFAPLDQACKYAEIDNVAATSSHIVGKIKYSLVVRYNDRSSKYMNYVRALEMTGKRKIVPTYETRVDPGSGMPMQVMTYPGWSDSEVEKTMSRMNHTYFPQVADQTDWTTVASQTYGSTTVPFKDKVTGSTSSIIFRVVRKTEVENRRNDACNFVRITGMTLNLGNNISITFSARDMDLFFQENEYTKKLNGNLSYGAEHWQCYTFDFGVLRTMRYLSGLVDLSSRNATLTVNFFNPGTASDDFQLRTICIGPMEDTYYAKKISTITPGSSTWGGYAAYRM